MLLYGGVRVVVQLCALLVQLSVCLAQAIDDRAAMLLEPQCAKWTEAEVALHQERAKKGEASAAYQVACYMLSQHDAEKRNEAFAWAAKAADSGVAEACMLVGICYYDGVGVKRDAAQALAWFEKAFKMGCKRVLNALAYAYVEGWGGSKDEKKAWEYVERSVAEGVPGALVTKALFYVEGAGVPVDLSKAKELLRKEIELNPDNALALYNLAAVEKKLSPESGGEVERLLHASAEKKYASAYFALAQMYLYGDGVTRDAEKAAGYMQKSVDAGITQALCELADMYAAGHGVQRNMQKARLLYQQAIDQEPNNGATYFAYAVHMLEYEQSEMDVSEFESLLKKAAELGHVEAMKGLASEYLDNEGLLPQNMPGFVKWCLAAAEAGESWALLNAASMWLNGVGVTQDAEKAALYTKKAVALGIPEAYGRMAGLYKQGIGVEQDISKAIELYRMALRAEPENGLYYRELALLLMLSDSYDDNEIESLLLKAVELGEPK